MTRTLKRFGRLILGGAIGGGVTVLLAGLKAEPYYPFIAPTVIAVLASMGKFLREKGFNNIPF